MTKPATIEAYEDDLTTARVKRALLKEESVSLSDIDVVTQKGAVRLSGSVSSAEAMQAADQAAFTWSPIPLPMFPVTPFLPPLRFSSPRNRTIQVPAEHLHWAAARMMTTKTTRRKSITTKTKTMITVTMTTRITIITDRS